MPVRAGSTVREIVQSVLQLAGLDDVFTSHGVELDDTIHPRRLPGPKRHDDSPRTGRPPRGHRDR